MVLLATFGGCADPAGTCGVEVQPVTRLDGGMFACIKAEDCPRPSNVLVCVTREPEGEGCVSCEETRCIRQTPKECP
jgi:hypothetical protein